RPRASATKTCVCSSPLRPRSIRRARRPPPEQQQQQPPPHDMATAYATPTALPADIRLMNAAATVLGAIGLVALVATGLLWFARQPMFALHSIRVDGDLAHNSALTIRANAAPRIAGNFFTMDLAATRRAFESVPWVRRAIVRRVWPD